MFTQDTHWQPKYCFFPLPCMAADKDGHWRGCKAPLHTLLITSYPPGKNKCWGKNNRVWEWRSALEQRNSPVVSLHLTPGSPKLPHLFWPNIITFGTKTLYVQTGWSGLGCSYNSYSFSKLGLKPVIFSVSTSANTSKCSWSSLTFLLFALKDTPAPKLSQLTWTRGRAEGYRSILGKSNPW